ncbi:MAG: T9SS type A sorting domain-containing protein [Altibacter sp.]|nr:T9SS type A sorting domain-containing protein [Altibacter sp.]
MKFKLLLISFTFIFSFSEVHAQDYLEMIDSETYTVQEIVAAAEAYFADKDKGRGSGYKQFKRWEYNALRLMNEAGYLPSITQRLEELKAYNKYLNETAQSRMPLNDNWIEKGPVNWNASTSWNPGVGRVTGIAVDASNNDHIIIGANTGGVWRTIDGGQNWTPLGDTFTNLRVYSVAIDPSDSNTYFFGSVNGLIFKSTDAGGTWNLLGDIGSSEVNKILIHPTNTNIMYATASYFGIRKSVDGGLTWSQAVSDSNGFDVEFKPGDPNTVYASGRGFHKSTDGGQTFTTVGGFTNGFKMIGVSAANVDRVYVLEESSGRFGAFYSSNDGGNSFTELNHTGKNYFGYSTTANDNSGQAPRDMDVTVNPNNADEVHIAGVLTWRSLNAGTTFTCTADWIPNAAAGAGIGYCHADVDIMEFIGTTLYVGTDGGIFKATDTGNLNANYYEDLTEGIGIRQFYKIGISQTQDVVVTGGSQDNGTSFFTEANGWIDWLGADGMEGFVDKNNTNVMYGMIQGGRMYRTDDGANSISDLPEPGSGSGNWVTPFEQDPSVTNTIYLGYDRVYKSLNKGLSWSSISQNFGSNLEHLKIAPSNNQVMYAADNGTLYRTEDGGASNWITTTAPGGAINSIAIHPADPMKIAVATTSANKVYVSADGGDTWQDYKKNLPNFSALAMVWHDNGTDGLYVGMDYGIYYIDDTFNDWQPFFNNLPNVIINELEINTVTNEIYAASYGRGLWVSPVADNVLGIETASFLEGSKLYPNPANQEITLSITEALETDLRVFDTSGKLVLFLSNVWVDRNYTLNVSTLQSGLYFIRINSEKGTVTKKFIKE